MSRQLSALDQARRLLRARRFPDVLSLLENKIFDYRDSFDYFFILGTACMYLGDSGGANTWFQGARKIRSNDISLDNAQAALYLRRGDTDKAVDFYLRVLEYDPQNRLAHAGLQFIKEKGDAETIAEWVSNGKIRRFFPPLGPNILWIKRFVLVAACCAVIGCAVAVAREIAARRLLNPSGPLPGLALSADERSDALQRDMSGASYRDFLSAKDVVSAYDSARAYFGEGRDNAAQVEINRIRNSNASDAIKEKSLQLADYFEPPGFDTIKDNYPYETIASAPYLYDRCWVVWSGRVTNIRENEGRMYCDLLVGYETMQRVAGIVPVEFAVAPAVVPSEPVRILGQLETASGKIILNGKSIYQPMP